jgi:hypothetical protein
MGDLAGAPSDAYSWIDSETLTTQAKISLTTLPWTSVNR